MFILNIVLFCFLNAVFCSYRVKIMDDIEFEDQGNIFSFKSIQTTDHPKKRKLSNTIMLENDEGIHIRNEVFHRLDEDFTKFESDIINMKISDNKVDRIFKSVHTLLLSCENGLKNSTETEHENGVSNVFSYIKEKLEARTSARKRLNIMKNKKSYVAPIQKPIGIKWKSAVSPTSDIVGYTYKQSSYSFVSIIETIKQLFSNEIFEQKYFEFNTQLKHQCIPGIYKNFCCGDNYKKNDIFERSQNVIQIQLSIDDVEPCHALKHRIGKHKFTAIYFSIRNIPEDLRSKLVNIFLVAIITVADLKNEDMSFDIVAKTIIKELKILETSGVKVKNDLTIEAALVNLTADNLGANSVFGFTEGFQSNYYCRICELSKTQCQKQTRENVNCLREKSTYLQNIEKFKTSGSLSESKGLKTFCLFNDLDSFNIFENYSIDIMHDILEGVVPYFMWHFFNIMSRKKNMSFSEMQKRVRDFNYGFVDTSKKPNLLKFNKDTRSLGQNATQYHFLINYFALIFNDKKCFLEQTWKAMEDLLNIIHIVFSSTITDANLISLENSVQKHLSYLVEMNCNLTPKHHNLTHYARVIRRMGPLIHMWAMRTESKHKVLTDIVKITQNYKNLPITLAKRHQEFLSLFLDTTSFESKIIKAKTFYDIREQKNFQKYRNCSVLLNINCYFSLKFVKLNTFQYRTGLLLINNHTVYEIIYIFANENVSLFCHPYIILEFDRSLNGIEIKKEESFENCRLFNLCEMKYRKSFARITCNNKQYIVAETLDMLNECLL